jgi:hypothetical protein
MLQLPLFVLSPLLFYIPQLLFLSLCSSMWFEEDIIVERVF